MIRRSALIASGVAVLVIAGCSSKDGGSSPTPTPTPTPSTSPTPTYASFPLTAAAELFTVSAAMSYTGDVAGPVTLGTAGTDGFSNRVRFALQNAVASTSTAETVVRENNEENRFTGADLLTAPAAGMTEYVFRETTAPTTAGAFYQLDLFNNTIENPASTTTPKESFQPGFKRVSYGGWWRGDSTAGAKRVTYATTGYPTVASDMPTTGSVTYTVVVAGRSVVSPAAGASSVDKLTGTATLTINYATGLVNLSMTLNRGGTAYGTFTGTGAIAAGNNQFTGSFGTGSTAGGTFQGLAYGPKAAEIGITFAITGAVAGGDSRAVGVVIGRTS